MNNTLHSACAVIFFICMVFYCSLLTVCINKVRQVNPDFISENSWQTKKWLSIGFLVTLASLIAALFKQDWGVPVAEWTATYIVIFYLKSFAEDFEGYLF